MDQCELNGARIDNHINVFNHFINRASF